MKSLNNKCEMCGECCRTFFINLNEAEYQSGEFKTFFEDINSTLDFPEASLCGANFVAKKEDGPEGAPFGGSCVYLKDNSCIIHAKRPGVCRDYFCNS